mmetsp:Transcript_2466/g.6636  ORF Transcript_2466/g.6636 Transcript_2466/m.6636 type:complete len:295 (-) Transcript_2466:9-893(-)
MATPAFPPLSVLATSAPTTVARARRLRGRPRASTSPRDRRAPRGGGRPPGARAPPGWSWCSLPLWPSDYTHSCGAARCSARRRASVRWWVPAPPGSTCGLGGARGPPRHRFRCCTARLAGPAATFWRRRLVRAGWPRTSSCRRAGGRPKRASRTAPGAPRAWACCRTREQNPLQLVTLAPPGTTPARGDSSRTCSASLATSPASEALGPRAWSLGRIARAKPCNSAVLLPRQATRATCPTSCPRSRNRWPSERGRRVHAGMPCKCTGLCYLRAWGAWMLASSQPAMAHSSTIFR